MFSFLLHDLGYDIFEMFPAYAGGEIGTRLYKNIPSNCSLFSSSYYPFLQ